MHQTRNSSVILLVILCVSAAAQQRLDLATKQADAEIIGAPAFNQTGRALAIGDVNGDKIPDLIIGAPGLDAQLKPLAGRVYVIFGHKNFSGLLDLNFTAADIEIVGRQSNGGLGTAVAVADLNHDGFGDIIMGEPGANTTVGQAAGIISVIWGRPAFPKIMQVTGADVQIHGEAALNNFGEAVAAGDLNHDGLSDLIIGVRFASPPNRANGGKVYVIYGSATLPALIDLSERQSDLVIWGRATTHFMGNAVAAGDLDNDSRDDLIIGDFKANSLGGVDAGRVFVFFSNPAWRGVIDLTGRQADLTIYGANQQDHLGIAVATGDFNGDAKTDLIVGARRADDGAMTNAGKVFVFLNPASWPGQIDLAITSADLTITGSSAGAHLGFALAVGNFNHDGKDDLVIGAPFTSPSARNQSGAAHIFFGRATIAQKIMQAESADLTVVGAAAEHTLGNAVAVGDINHDGRQDIILSAESAAPAGRVYVLSGDFITGVDEPKTARTILANFQLLQNYPNPFNPTTTIRFSLARPSFVTLKIYNTLGREAATLVNKKFSAGSHEMKWNASGLPGGLYLYRLQSDGFVQTRKLILAK